MFTVHRWKLFTAVRCDQKSNLEALDVLMDAIKKSGHEGTGVECVAQVDQLWVFWKKLEVMPRVPESFAFGCFLLGLLEHFLASACEHLCLCVSGQFWLAVPLIVFRFLISYVYRF